MESVIGDSHDPAVGGELLAAPGNNPGQSKYAGGPWPRFLLRLELHPGASHATCLPSWLDQRLLARPRSPAAPS
jgi:hypothetical protein